MILLAEPWLHNLDPFAIQIDWFPGGGLRWYGLSYLAGFALGLLLIRRVLTVGASPLKPLQATDLAVTVAIGIVLGGRLGYVLFYKPELILAFDNDLPWWGVLKINEGGMASHGGMLGAIAASFFFAWRQGVPKMHMIDLVAFGAPLGLMMGRVANFINGELYGRVCPADSPLYPLAVRFPQEIYDDYDEKAGLWQSDRIDDLQAFAGPTFENGHQAVGYAIVQVQSGNAQWIAFMNEHVAARYPSQLIAGLTEGLVVFAVLAILYRKPVKAGLIGGWFCMTYAVMRIANEFFRMPDKHHLVESGDLPLITRGQLLSIGLLALGIATIVIAMRSKGDKLGGWMKNDKANLATDEHG